MPALTRACSQKLSYLKTLKRICIRLHMYVNSYQHMSQTKICYKKRTLVKRYLKKKKKEIRQLCVCLFFNLLFVCLFVLLIFL